MILSASLCGCMSPAQQRARNFVRSDARSDGANAAADRCGGAVLIEGRTGYSRDDHRCAPQENALVDGIDRLAGAPSGSLEVSDVALALNRSFEHVARTGGFGELYVAGTVGQPLYTKLYALPDLEFRLEIDRLQNEHIAEWRSRLLEKGWNDAGIIRHPFVQDAFYKNGKQIRLQHNMDTIQSVVVLGLNVSKAL
ncbi:hypothetical protein FHS95_000073 [Sphingomonas naasensis]|uniref:Uncharacterized protein n=1 Tax=Sphingomonas naasensis TaxID=1344951 RepID=A0A4S1WQP1_9SPHN|nr:hypothetical protein [Sphingomonas naasensis]NIJ18404.1 hypothetical protein [Sphingomonas naasensis]TGX45671.1 hypothetical protein E5A74_00365 [Sphingomonas naasensis]